MTERLPAVPCIGWVRQLLEVYVTLTMRTTEGRERAYSWDLRARAQDVEGWRRAVGEAVGVLGGDADAVALARLGVSELLANVVRHVDDPRCCLLVEEEQGLLYVRVFDRSRDAPAVTMPDWDAESGRGLWLLREMTDAFGYTCTPGGKWVWFRCRRAGEDAGEKA
ncbi:ATP-binding protein [Streptomyces sp. JJ66]|uniref:ATP-binding protein n=1 Tax=Streptomyces sp. JJ66 TaxID=2803843 RepID=UPI0027E27310|nr:ATP-binding protein [Streptomyces sp. JJ66]